MKSDGERRGGSSEDGRLELLWSRPVAAFWDVQAGVRRDFGKGPKRSWLALGVQGVAPYMYDVEAIFYVGPYVRTRVAHGRVPVGDDQRTFLTPEVEANFYGNSGATATSPRPGMTTCRRRRDSTA